MAFPPPTVLVALDAASFLVAALTAAFFWRAHRVLPGRGFELLAMAFLALGVGWAAVAVSTFDLLPRQTVVDAVRVAGSFVGVSLLAVTYVARRMGLRLRSVALASLALAGGAALLIVLYVVVPPAARLPEPMVYLPWLRLTEGGLLVLSAFLVALEVRGSRLSELRVPLALVLLALEKYSVGVLLIHGVTDPSLVPWLWRLGALVVLLALVLPLRRWPPAPA